MSICHQKNIPLCSHMAPIEFFYKGEVLLSKIWIVQRTWMNVILLKVRQISWCTLGHYTWKVEGGPIIQQSLERISGFVEYDMVCKVASEILPHMYLTTSMHSQAIRDQLMTWYLEQWWINKGRHRRGTWK